ncbi:hypothetical protein GUITHDRAFT_141839 [Guillardia theta CCMP2712]|uniref:Uncharacterized protein n=1 Tax=Guillardia theta (strain CCMP2712) TaxID=905079 RepID=L1IZQ6_GUITC|nr:hypothetical protein GUITHDRAFT_141839 [Guillardia theta CCMP2712]EKX41577.1 hypothetical protein GUITHDRAFT_141839 [Guillardia theta CCMP2712]|eukprot:XP_005828557.1 hypothetical protein GUITHDRAFT_141839 [Guillardia theta CCMP2712]
MYNEDIEMVRGAGLGPVPARSGTARSLLWIISLALWFPLLESYTQRGRMSEPAASFPNEHFRVALVLRGGKQGRGLDEATLATQGDPLMSLLTEFPAPACQFESTAPVMVIGEALLLKVRAPTTKGKTPPKRVKKKEKNEKAERGVKNAKARNKGRKAAVNDDPEGLPGEEEELSEKNVELPSSEKLLERKSELSRVRSLWSQTGRMFHWEGAEQGEEKEENERERQEETPEREEIQSFDKKAKEKDLVTMMEETYGTRTEADGKRFKLKTRWIEDGIMQIEEESSEEGEDEHCDTRVEAPLLADEAMKSSTKEEEAEEELSQERDHSKMKMNPHRRAHELKKLTKKKEEEEQDRRVKEGRQSMKAGPWAVALINKLRKRHQRMISKLESRRDPTSGSFPFGRPLKQHAKDQKQKQKPQVWRRPGPSVVNAQPKHIIFD